MTSMPQDFKKKLKYLHIFALLTSFEILSHYSYIDSSIKKPVQRIFKKPVQHRIWNYTDFFDFRFLERVIVA